MSAFLSVCHVLGLLGPGDERHVNVGMLHLLMLHLLMFLPFLSVCAACEHCGRCILHHWSCNSCCRSGCCHVGYWPHSVGCWCWALLSGKTSLQPQPVHMCFDMCLFSSHCGAACHALYSCVVPVVFCQIFPTTDLALGVQVVV